MLYLKQLLCLTFVKKTPADQPFFLAMCAPVLKDNAADFLGLC